jgi:hypothetical protein
MKIGMLIVSGVLIGSMSLILHAQGNAPDPENTSPTVDEIHARPNDPYRAEPTPVNPNTNPSYANPSVRPGTPGTESTRGTGSLNNQGSGRTGDATGAAGTAGPNGGFGSAGTSGAAASGTH